MWKVEKWPVVRMAQRTSGAAGPRQRLGETLVEPWTLCFDCKVKTPNFWVLSDKWPQNSLRTCNWLNWGQSPSLNGWGHFCWQLGGNKELCEASTVPWISIWRSRTIQIKFRFVKLFKIAWKLFEIPFDQAGSLSVQITSSENKWRGSIGYE